MGYFYAFFREKEEKQYVSISRCRLSSKTGSSAKDSYIRTYPTSEHPVYIRIFNIIIYDLLKFAEELVLNGRADIEGKGDPAGISGNRSDTKKNRTILPFGPPFTPIYIIYNINSCLILKSRILLLTV